MAKGKDDLLRVESKGSSYEGSLAADSSWTKEERPWRHGSPRFWLDLNLGGCRSGEGDCGGGRG